MAKFVSIEEAVALIPDGATIMIGGFLGCGNPHRFIDALSKSGKGNFTLIANDASVHNGPNGEEFYGIAKLVHNKQIKKLIASHVGTNPEVATQNMVDGTLEVFLLPQGSLAEMMRSGGGGLGGVLTPTGVGTIVEESPYCLGKINVNGRDYLHMAPIRADFALIGGHTVDKKGNVWYKGTTQNYNLSMATAADTVIVEAENIVEIGAIEPENVRTSAILVDYIVEGGIING